jgi:hypothetical protein
MNRAKRAVVALKELRLPYSVLCKVIHKQD